MRSTVRSGGVLRALAIICCAAATVLGAASAATAAPANINLTRASGNQREGAIAINPRNPQQMFVASVDAANKDLIAARSSDGGATWTISTIAYGNGTAPGAAGLAGACCNVSATFDEYGNLFITYLGVVPYTYVLFAYSTDGGASFKGLTYLQKLGDQPTVTAARGEVWLTYSLGSVQAASAPVTGLGQVGKLTNSAVPGEGTSPIAYGNYGDIAIGPKGQVALTYGPTSGSTGGPLYINVKPDGLGPAPFRPATQATNSNVGGFTYVPAQPDWGIDAEAGLAWDRSGGAHNGRLYLMYTDSPVQPSTNSAIYVRHSDNEGATWSEPVAVSAPTPTTSQLLPRISLDQSTGAVGVTWWDTRNDPLNKSVQYFGAISTDGGETFGPAQQLSAGTSNEAWAPNQAGVAVDQDLGDYTGSAFTAGRLWGLWADNSNSTLDNPNGAKNAFNIYTGYLPGPTPPPSMTVTFPAANSRGWYTAAPVTGTATAEAPLGTGTNVVSLTCTGAEVLSTSGLGTPSATASLSIAADGVDAVHCTAVTSAGSEAGGEATVRLDSHAPVLAPSLSSAARPLLLGEAVTAAANASDPLSGGFASGIASEGCEAVETATAGAKSLTCTATDVAGNTSTATLAYTVAPPPTAALAFPAANSNGWYTSGPVNGTVTAEEPSWAGATIASIACTGAAVQSTSGLGTASASASVTVSGDGVHAVRCSATASTHVQASSAESTLRIDTHAPTLAPTLSSSSQPLVIGEAVSANANAVDPLSEGFASGIASQGCEAVETATIGSKSVACTASDVAGNSSTASISYVVGYAVHVSAPVPGSSVTPGQVIAIRFQLTNAAGTPIPDAVAAALGCNVSVTLGTVKRCATYHTRGRVFTAGITVSKKAAPGPASLNVSVLSGVVQIGRASVGLTVL